MDAIKRYDNVATLPDSRISTARRPLDQADTEPMGRPAADGGPVGGPGSIRLVPMMLTNRRGSRPIGAFAVGPQGVRYHPVVDVRVVTFVVAGVATAVAAASAAVALRRRGPVIGSVAMGPGGWVSVKGVAVPPLWPAGRQQHGRRPWWARLLGARRLVVQQ